MIVGIDHVQLAMPAGGEDKAREFYAGFLGLPEVPKPPELAKRGGAWFERGAVRIHLGVDPEFRPARKAHPGLLVYDLAHVLAAARSRGYAVDADDVTTGPPPAYVSAPFGNRLELIQASGAETIR